MTRRSKVDEAITALMQLQYMAIRLRLGLAEAERCDLVDCSWPGCTARDNPVNGWVFWWRYWRWLPEGFYCPEHNARIEEGQKSGAFKDWPLDTSEEVLKFRREVLDGVDLVPLYSEGQTVLDEIEARPRPPWDRR